MKTPNPDCPIDLMPSHEKVPALILVPCKDSEPFLETTKAQGKREPWGSTQTKICVQIKIKRKTYHQGAAFKVDIYPEDICSCRIVSHKHSFGYISTDV